MQPSSPYKSILLLSVLLVLISLFLLVRNIAEPFEFNFWALAILWLNSIPIYKYLFDLCRTDANLQFNKRYNMVDPEVTVSPYPLPVLAEMYMNFGVRGIIIGMFILALIYVLLNRYFNRIENNEINKMYGLAFLIGYISIEGNFTMTFGTIPLILITLFGIFFILNIIYNLFTRYIIVY